MFNRKSLSAALVPLLLSNCLALNAQTKTSKDQGIKVRTSDTAQLKVLLENQKVDAVLTDGTRVKCKVREVKDSVLVIKVASSEGAAALTKGEQSLATDRFSTLEITSYKGKKRGILAATLGAAGLFVGMTIGTAEEIGGGRGPDALYAAVLAATTAGGVAAGYYLGRKLDRKRLTIVMIK